MRFVLAFVLLVLSMTPALAQSTTFYDKHGNRQGSISREGQQNVVRDKNGNREGYYEKQGNETVYRDKNGNRLGSSR
jgi:hypothetical protein